MKESASHHVNKSLSFIFRRKRKRKIDYEGFLELNLDGFHQKPNFSKNLKIIILIFVIRFSIDTGSFEDCSRKLEIQRKMYLKVVERSL